RMAQLQMVAMVARMAPLVVVVMVAIMAMVVMVKDQKLPLMTEVVLAILATKKAVAYQTPSQNLMAYLLR
ncbi:hypothetical protein GCK32_011795, partial [Trichostrongylus colubriformis]